MSTHLPSYRDRDRADSFGSAAHEYDAYRPRYPDALIGDLVTAPGLRILDVGAGTGIASAQLAAAGARVLAVEPDARMADVARGKGIEVEEAVFEEWEPRGRTFDLVVFAQSFHWVDPDVALPKVRAILDDGRLALIWNRIRSTDPPEEVFERIHATIRRDGSPETNTPERRARLRQAVDAAGFTTEMRRYPTSVHLSADEYLGQVFTYSRQLILDPDTRDHLRVRLAAAIGDAGVAATNDAVAVTATPNPSNTG